MPLLKIGGPSLAETGKGSGTGDQSCGGDRKRIFADWWRPCLRQCLDLLVLEVGKQRAVLSPKTLNSYPKETSREFGRIGAKKFLVKNCSKKG